MYKQDWVLNNVQGMIHHKIQPNKKYLKCEKHLWLISECLFFTLFLGLPSFVLLTHEHPTYSWLCENHGSNLFPPILHEVKNIFYINIDLISSSNLRLISMAIWSHWMAKYAISGNDRNNNIDIKSKYILSIYQSHILPSSDFKWPWRSTSSWSLRSSQYLGKNRSLELSIWL